jgi:hypothetical protein
MTDRERAILALRRGVPLGEVVKCSCFSDPPTRNGCFGVCEDTVAEPYTAGSLKAAWWVLTGKAYAFEWPKPGDLEKAIGMPLYDRSRFKPTGTQQGAA